jgi:RimJ/RimL family protein N-acetyltransferase
MTTAPASTDGPVTLRPVGAGRAEVAVAHGDPEAVQRALERLLDRAFDEQGVRTVHWHVPVGDWDARRVAHRLGFAHEGLLRDWLPGSGPDLDDAWLCTLVAGDARQPRSTWLEVPVLEADGVRLRPFTDADVPRIVEGLGDREVQHWLSFMPREPGETDARRYLEKVRERLATGHTLAWAFCTPDDDRLLGEVGLYRLAEEAELGYWTHPEGRGRGLTTRAARLAADHAFDTLGLDRLAACAAAANTASRRVLERLGFRAIGVQRRAATTGDGAPADLAAYDLLPGERAHERITA